ncbi:hypothetical protein ACFRMN_37940 [Streptomyces sp. NPDC056835]|uniref:hypothetical protein n=1 Tax=Streptomyces sp. NPDC056835 TaxID=3345956 RepID=UPI0036CA5D91
MHSTRSWESVNVSLAITKMDISADFVNNALGFDDDQSAHGARIYSGPHWWAYTYTEESAGDLEAMAISLTQRIRPRLDRVDALLRSGHSAQVAIAGTVETGDQLFISPTALEQLASLALPVSFTSLTLSGTQEEDPLSWLEEG